MRWIKASEKVPSDERDVIVWQDNIGATVGAYSSETDRFYDMQHNYKVLHNVTYWANIKNPNKKSWTERLKG